ncbi:MAG TPA: signal recognition particle-docking protein FtsY [Gemmatimonadales bacterium]|jgi:fused signal recognition particle receptor|nr:signal recognition particle-docking protein FtsY [Gemmatimonadales bacterium]
MGLWEKVGRIFTGGAADSTRLEDVQRLLVEADFGVAATNETVARLSRADKVDQATLERIVLEQLGPPGAPLARAPAPPTVILVFGVNGTGKTTSVAKLAKRLQADGRSVLLAAADTFRAGATEQLKAWADRLGVPFVGATQRGDPAAVAFDAVEAATTRGVDTVLVDTAGRLHTDERLREELKKVVRVVGKRQAGAPHESLLVLDATVGQNAVRQAEAFAAAVPLTGLVITKLDGTAKGGSVVALRRTVPVPIRFLGTGETLEDLELFDPVKFAHRLVSE